MHALLVPAALSIGALLAVQAAANLQLAGAMGSPVGASTAQLAVGTTVLVALAAALGTLGALSDVPGAAAWHLVGGFGSAIYISAGILLFPRLAALTAVGLFIAGQMLASLAVDGYGLARRRARGLPSRARAGRRPGAGRRRCDRPRRRARRARRAPRRVAGVRAARG